jgi:hypothetical protein
MYNVIAACCFALFGCVAAGQTGGTPSHPHAFTSFSVVQVLLLK